MSDSDNQKLEQAIEVSRYEKDYSEKGLWEKIRDNVKAIGLSLIYKALQLFQRWDISSRHSI